MNRRDFLAMMGIGASALFLQSCGVDTISDGSSSNDSGNNLSSQALFENPSSVQIDRNGNIVELDLKVKTKQVNINGQDVELLTYNGQYPAPTIRVKSGDLVRVNFKNEIPSNIGTNGLGNDMSITNLHTHGWHVDPTGNADNVMLEFLSGDTFNFEYDLSKQWGGMMGFYHPHKHGTVAEQMWRGLSGGALIVEDDTVLNDFEEKIMILSDISVSNGQPTPWSRMDYMRKFGNIVMVNGQVNPVLEIRPGQVQRWRIVNASVYRFYRLSLENHKIYLVGTDSNILDKPVELDEIIMAPGERIDILIKANQAAGSYKLYSKAVNGADSITLLTVDYAGSSTNDNIPDIISSDIANDVKNLRQMNISNLRNVDMTLNFVGGGMSGGSMGMKGAINGKVFGENTYILESTIGTYEIWNIYNQTGMPHPFHQHVDASVILEVTGGYSDYGNLYSSINAYKDVIIVPPMGSVKMLVPVTDFTGDTMFHCHMLGHEDIGMMGIWRRV